MEHDEVEGNDTHQDELLEALKRTYGMATSIEPALGAVARPQVDALRFELDGIAKLAAPMLAQLPQGEDREGLEGLLAIVYARCAAVAIAAADEATAHRWLVEAERFATDDQLRHELTAARSNPERYRKLVHGRNLVANGRDAAARKLWAELAKAGAGDTIARVAADELKAPRPLKPGELPTLWRYYGFGLGFYGGRDRWPDGSYVATHCASALWIPLLPIRSYRVRDEGDGYIVMAREQLSAFAKIARLTLVLGTVALIAWVAINSHLNDPARLARKRFDAMLETVASAPPEAALRGIDAELAMPDLTLVGSERAEQAGVRVIKLTAGFVAKPFTAASLDQAGRLVRRYQGLPELAKEGATRDAVIEALDGWIKDLPAGPETTESRLALLRLEAEVADPARAAAIKSRISATRLEVAAAKATDWPLDALAVIAEDSSEAGIKITDEIVGKIADSPSLLADAGKDLDAWMKATKSTELRDRAEAQRALALAAADETEAEKLTAAQLAAMAKKRPWDQRVVMRQASDEASAGKLEPAAARLAKIGKPGLMIREARMLLGQLSSAIGKLEEADMLLSSLLGGRLQRYVAASAKLEEAANAAEARVRRQLDTGSVPIDVQRKYEAAVTDEAKREVVVTWASESVSNDGAVIAAREAVMAFSDIVPVSLAAGTVKLRRAQALPEGPARNAMLVEAERTFLAIRTQAEGQPEFRLGLGEIYARLGKTKESEAEFTALLEKKEPQLSLRVAQTYRAIGSVERAETVAREVYDQAGSDKEHKHRAAVLLGLLTQSRDEEEGEGWFRKGDQTDPFVRTVLLEAEGHRLLRQGKRTECAAKFAQAAKAHLAMAGAARVDGYNNAGVAQLSRFECNGDLAVLAEAETQFEKAYRASREDPIVVGNFARVLNSNGRMRVLGKRIDLRAYQPTSGEADALIAMLLDSPDRDAVLADLASDPGMRRSEQVYAEYEVLAPNSTGPYTHRFEQAVERRDEAAAATVVERARKAKNLDLSRASASRDKWTSGGSDEKMFEAFRAQLAKLESIATRAKLDPKTRAAVQLAIATSSVHGVYSINADLLRRGREAAARAMKLWPALDTNASIVSFLIDEAGIAADAKAWITERRTRTSVSSLAKLLADKSPLAGKIMASKQWAEVGTYARADGTRPGLDDVRLARLLGDASLEPRAKAALGDKLRRLDNELDLLFDPTDESSKDDLGLLEGK